MQRGRQRGPAPRPGLGRGAGAAPTRSSPAGADRRPPAAASRTPGGGPPAAAAAAPRRARLQPRSSPAWGSERSVARGVGLKRSESSTPGSYGADTRRPGDPAPPRNLPATFPLFRATSQAPAGSACWINPCCTSDLALPRESLQDRPSAARAPKSSPPSAA